MMSQQYNSMTVVLAAKFHTNLSTRKETTGKRYYMRFHLWSDFGHIIDDVTKWCFICDVIMGSFHPLATWCTRVNIDTQERLLLFRSSKAFWVIVCVRRWLWEKTHTSCLAFSIRTHPSMVSVTWFKKSIPRDMFWVNASRVKSLWRSDAIWYLGHHWPR